MFKYLTRFTDSGRYRNQIVNAPPSATRPSYGGSEVDDDDLDKGDGNNLTSEYKRMPSSPADTYEVPIERQGAYEDVQPRGLGASTINGGNLENAGGYMP